jgi:hypothetical protein
MPDAAIYPGIKRSRSVIQDTDFGVGNLTLDTTLADMNPMLEFSPLRSEFQSRIRE